MLMRSNRRSLQKGVALVEFALSWAVMWVVFWGLFEFGYAFYTYNVLLTSVNNAAELGSKMTFDGASRDTFTTQLKNMVVYGDTTAGARPIIPNLSIGNVNVTLTPATGFPVYIKIDVTYEIDVVLAKFQLTNKPQVTTTFTGQTLCTGC
jgi:Flp pilus assembly protein TadG